MQSYAILSLRTQRRGAVIRIVNCETDERDKRFKKFLRR